MTTRHFKQTLRGIAAIGGTTLALALVGCGGYVDVDGYDAAYASAPVGIESYPHYSYNGADVYDVDGHYYRQHEGRWVTYHRVPAEVSRWHDDRGRAERQR
jgi:hypothetical protein